MAWYENRNPRVDIDRLFNIKAKSYENAANSLNDLAKVVEDRKKRLQDEELYNFKINDLKNKQEDYQEQKEQKQNDKTYLKYVNSSSGKVDEESLLKDNPNFNINSVSQDTLSKVANIRKTYNDNLTKIADKNILSAVFDSKNKYDFFNKVNKEDLDNASSEMKMKLNETFNKQENEDRDYSLGQQKINNDIWYKKQQLENSNRELGLKEKEYIKKQEKEKTLNTATESLINRAVDNYFKDIDPNTGELKISNSPEDIAKRAKIKAEASNILKDNPNIPINEALNIVLSEYTKNNQDIKEEKTEKQRNQEKISNILFR